LRWAGYLDGGGSLEAIVRGGIHLSAGEHRPVGSFLAVLEPSTIRDVVRFGEARPLPTLVLASSVLVGSIALYYAIRESKRVRQTR
jgi:hypothetical protein